MVALGEDVSGQVMKFLSDFEIEEITQAITALKNVTPAVAVMDQVLQEFEHQMMAGEWISQGGLDFCPRYPRAGCGATAGAGDSGSGEHPYILWVLCPEECPPADRPFYLPRTSTDSRPYPVANLRDILGGNQDVGGPSVVADILNLTGSSVERNVLGRMDGTDPEIAEQVRNMMFVFNDLVKLTDREFAGSAEGGRRGVEEQGSGQHVRACTPIPHRGDGVSGAHAADQAGRGTVAYRAAVPSARGAGTDRHHSR
jgi:flagellar motor switch protein FliG